MRLLLISVSLMISFSLSAQIPLDKLQDKKNELLDSAKKIENQLNDKVDKIITTTQDILSDIEPVWDQGVPIMPDDEYITNLTDKLDLIQIRDNKALTEKQKSICREIGMSFYDRGLMNEANWYLSRSKDFHYNYQTYWEKEKVEEVKEEPSTAQELQTLQSDLKTLSEIPASFDNLPKEDLKNLASQIDRKIKLLLAERDSLLKSDAKPALIESKNNTIKSLSKDKEIIDLTIVKGDLEVENQDLEIQKSKLKTYLIWVSIVLSLLGLAFVVVLQRKRIKVQDTEIDQQYRDIAKKNTYLEHAARIIRHDMHSGINTYIPRGINSLEKRITPEELQKLKIDGPVKMIKEGLNHTQKVYKSVYEFTNLVKQDVVLNKVNVNLQGLLSNYFAGTSYKNQVEISELKNLDVNEVLFCNAIENLVKNGLKYNDSEEKKVKIYLQDNNLIVEDNGKGMTQKQFEKISIAYLSKKNEDIDQESSGLGLNICQTILNEHGFNLSCEKVATGTKMIIKLS